ncbi:MAG: TonB-dependent receptor [Candidatus Solibacter sp.]
MQIVRSSSIFRLGFAIGIFAAAAAAQSFRGSITGMVTDSSGAAIAGAAVKLDSTATGLARSALTNAQGQYLFADLAVGEYAITVTQAGFEARKVDKIEVAVSKTTNLNLQLGIAQQQQLVEVSASAATIETSSTALVSVVDTKTVADLPMNGRDFRQMIKLAPGVSPASTSVNGMRTSGNNYQIDGADNNDAFQNAAAVNQGGVAGIAGTLLPIEAIDQFSVQSNAGADTGRNGGSAVNVVIKSGTNTLHGSAYYFNRNEALASRSPFQSATSPKQVIRNNQFGFSLGGPVIHNQTFFFVNGESQLSNANNSLLDTIPSDEWAASAKNVLTSYGVPVNPVSTNLLTIWPASTRAGGATTPNYLSNGRNDYNSYNGIIKMDHHFNASHSLSARYFGGTGTQTADVGSHIRDFFQVAPSHMHNFSVVENAVLTPSLVNQLTLGVNYFLQTFNDANTSFNPLALGLNTGVTDPTLVGSPKITISGFDYVGATQPLGRIDTTGHITDNLTWSHGRHQLRAGGEYRRARLDVFYQINKRGTFVFDGTRGPWSADASLGGNLRSMADFMAGYPSNSSGAVIVLGALQRDYYQNSFDWWAHDTVRLTPKLTLNFGVRYTYHGVLHDAKQNVTGFVPGQGFVGPGNGADTLYPKDWNNFAPRFGFAYTPARNGKTVIRGAYGVFFDVPALNFFVANTGLPNGGAAGINANPGGPNPVYTVTARNVVLQPGVPVFGSAGPVPPFGAFGIDQNFRTPYVQNFNVNVQRQLSSATLLQVGYVGSLGHKLPVLRDINQPIGGVRPFGAAYPTLATIDTAFSMTNSNYSSLQTQLRQSLWKGLAATLNYTYGHAIDNTSDVRNTVPTNSYDLRNERGNSTFDIRQIVTGFVSYQLPGSKFAPRLTKGWQVNSLVTLHGGTPLNILAGTNRSGSGQNRDRVDLVGDPFSGFTSTIPNSLAIQYITKAAFANPATGTFGNIGRNAIYGPGFGSVDFSVFKNTLVTERVHAEFRVEIFNLFNRTNYANPNATYSSGSFGQITATRNGGSAPGLGFGEPRNTQLGLRLVF